MLRHELFHGQTHDERHNALDDEGRQDPQHRAAEQVGEGCTQRRRKCAVLSAEQHNADKDRAVTQMRIAAGDGDRYLKGVRSGENERRHHGDAHDSF